MKKIYEKPLIEIEKFDVEVCMAPSTINGSGDPTDGGSFGGLFGDGFGSIVD